MKTTKRKPKARSPKAADDFETITCKGRVWTKQEIVNTINNISDVRFVKFFWRTADSGYITRHACIETPSGRFYEPNLKDWCSRLNIPSKYQANCISNKDESSLAEYVTRDWMQFLGTRRSDLMTLSEIKDKLKSTVLREGGFYTYTLWDTRYDPPVPFYVGKGKGFRITNHSMLSEKSNDFKYRLFRAVGALGSSILYTIDQYGLSESTAHEAERHRIALIGRRNLGRGPLTNLTDGGEGTSGSIGLRGANNPTSRAVYAGDVLYPALLMLFEHTE